MSQTIPKSAAEALRERSRQKIILIVLSSALMIGGLAVLFFLKRIPLPMRLVVGLGDIIAASALLLILRQKYVEKQS